MNAKLICLLLAAMPAWSACAPIPGASELLARSGLRYVVVGEIHGTTEGPALFGDLVCAAMESKREVVVGVERPAEEQSAIGAGDWKKLLASDGWKVHDGRSSQAMLALLKSLHGMKLAEIVAFDRGGATGAERDAGMATLLLAAAERHPGALVIVLTGNLHGSKKPMQRFGNYPFMAMLLPADATVSLYLADTGGTAWTQQGSGDNGPHAMGSSGGERREVAMRSAPMGGYDGLLSTGLPCTASAPAVGN